jgi:hypothetical protein
MSSSEANRCFLPRTRLTKAEADGCEQVSKVSILYSYEATVRETIFAALEYDTAA